MFSLHLLNIVVVIMVIAAGPLCLCPQCLEAAHPLSFSAEWRPAVLGSGNRSGSPLCGGGEDWTMESSLTPFILTPLQGHYQLQQH